MPWKALKKFKIRNDGRPIHHAIQMRDVDVLGDLIAEGADVEVVHGSETPLMHAVHVESFDFSVKGVWHVDMTALILAAGADPARAVGDPPRTALETAEKGGHWMAVSILKGWMGP
jgi:hypothetical protein